jgi:uncharacterized delta-60 repeat protein
VPRPLLPGVRFLRLLFAVLTFCGPAFAAAPAIVAPPADLAVGPGDRAGFVVEATGTAPLGYQWFHDGVRVPGATSDLLLIHQAATADAGQYSVSVTNAEGGVASSAATLVVARYSSQLVDPSFAPVVTYPATGSRYDSAAVLPDGRVIVGREGWGAAEPSVLRLLSTGAVDSTFTQPAELDRARVLNVVVASDGAVYLAGLNVGLSEAAGGFLYRLTSAGDLDRAFKAPPNAVRVPRPAGRDPLLPVGSKVIVASPSGGLVRLNGDGSVDSSFAYAPRQDASGAALPVDTASVDESGRIYVSSGSRVWRLNADGAADATFPLLEAAASVLQLEPLADGSLLVATRAQNIALSSSAGAQNSYTLIKFTPQHTPDPSFQAFSYAVPSDIELPAFGARAAFAVQPDARILVIGDIPTAVPLDSSRSAYRAPVIRLLADGTPDATYLPFDVPSGTSRFLGFFPDRRSILVGSDTITSLRRLSLESVGAPAAPRILRVAPLANPVLAGDDLTLQVIAVGAGPIQLGAPYIPDPRSTADTVVARNVQENSISPREVSARGPGGTARKSYTIVVTPSAPRVMDEPEAVTTSPGVDVQLGLRAVGSDGLRYEWFKDGAPMGDTREWIRLPNVSAVDVGTYVVRISNAYGMVERSIRVAFGPHSEFANVSARAWAATGERQLIIGVTVRGASPTFNYESGFGAGRQMLVRAIGPELGGFGISNPLPDPVLRVVAADGPAVVRDEPDFDFLALLSPTVFRYRQTGAFLVGGPSKSVVTLLTFGSGTYTLPVSDATGAGGVVLGELYAWDNSSGRIVNMSARGYVESGEKVLIAGFSIVGDKPKRVLIRAIGPTLQSFGVGSPLAHPRLTLVYQATGEVQAASDDWDTDSTNTEVSAVQAAVGAFPLPPASRDSMLAVMLAPGVYSAVVSGASGAGGVALVQIYEVP